MKDVVLVDGDIVAYRCAASAETLPSEVAEQRAIDLIRRIQYEVDAQDVQVYLGGSRNFRDEIWAGYKANRTQPKPNHLSNVRAAISGVFKTEICDGIEADDGLAINATRVGEHAVIATIDKDLLQVPGWHYQWEFGGTTSTGKQWNRPAVFQFISPFMGLRRFYNQLILGDGADNIPGFDGKTRSTCPQFIQKLMLPLEDMTTEKEMYDYVCTLYTDMNIMHRNAQLLYILREEGVYWTPPS